MMIHQQERNFEEIMRISKSTEEHMKDILRIKERCKTMAEEIINQSFYDEDAEEDLRNFATAYSLNLEEIDSGKSFGERRGNKSGGNKNSLRKIK